MPKINSQLNESSLIPVQNSEITVYKDGPAVVHEERILALASGKNIVPIYLIDGFVENSLTVLNLSGAGNAVCGTIEIKQETLTVDRILLEGTGTRVIISNAGSPLEEPIVGIILHIDGDQIILLNDQEKIEIIPIMSGLRYQLDAGVTKNLSASSSVKISLRTSAAGDYKLTTLYGVRGLRWNCYYEMFYNSVSTEIERFICWVEVVNEGCASGEVDLKFIAGANNGYDDQLPGHHAKLQNRHLNIRTAAPEFASYEPAEVDIVGKQKMYVLPETVSLTPDTTYQFVHFTANSVPVIEQYRLPEGPYEQAEDKKTLAVYKVLNLINNEESHLNVALPSGPVRIFEPDISGAYQRTDVAAIRTHISIAENFSLKLSAPASDIKAQRNLLEVKDVEQILPEQDPTTQPSNPYAGPAASAGQKAKTRSVTYRTEIRKILIFNYSLCAEEVQVTEAIPVSELQFLAPFTASGGTIITSSNGVGGIVTLLIEAPRQVMTSITYTIKYRLN